MIPYTAFRRARGDRRACVGACAWAAWAPEGRRERASPALPQPVRSSPLRSVPARREMSSALSPLGAPLPWDPPSSPQQQPAEPAEPEPPETVGWVAKFSRPCAVCREEIPVGQSIFPAGESGVYARAFRTSRSPVDVLHTKRVSQANGRTCAVCRRQSSCHPSASTSSGWGAAHAGVYIIIPSPQFSYQIQRVFGSVCVVRFASCSFQEYQN